MNQKIRVMSEKPLNAETRTAHLQSWITSNEAFFKRNQGKIMEQPVAREDWQLSIQGLVKNPLRLSFDDILNLPKIEMANTLECSGNSRSLLSEKASGNPWTIGGVGNALWGGVRLSQVLDRAGIASGAGHVSFEGLDEPLGSAGIRFIRSIPLAKAMDSTLLAFEMNGEALPLAHGYPLRALALGWTGANCVKWLSKLTLLDKPYAGFYMDRVYRVFQKGQEPASGGVVTAIPLKSIITAPDDHAVCHGDVVMVRGAAYAGETDVASVEVSVDGGGTWQAAEFIGPHQPYAWRRWEYRWEVSAPGRYTLMSRAIDSSGRVQPESASWNVLGYGNNGIREHAVSVAIQQ
jgi:DMSO/TMAO reductase YedYZ molybdopterin-dependent catalytic subunit